MGACLSAQRSSPATASRDSKPKQSVSPNKSSLPRSSSSRSPAANKPAWPAAAADVLPACDPVRLLGEGTFGTVVLVRERATQQLFAVKVMNKSQLVFEGQLDNIVLERQVLREAGPHPFVVQCHSGFQTRDAVVLVLEYVPGGDMYDLLRKHGCLSEEQARFYLAEVVVAVSELHQNDFVFRDLKLENILIDENGHVRLTDFGLAGKIHSGDAGERTIFDISGTAIYQAPEMLAGKGHGRVVDWWALGVLAYVLLAGRPPFSGDTREDLHRKITSQQLDLSKDDKLEHVSDIGKAFITELLDKNPATRLGSAGADAKDVQSHAFFADFDWKDVQNAKLKPPLQPGLQPSDGDSHPDDVELATRKLAAKLLEKHKPKRMSSVNHSKDLDAGEYKVVKVPRGGYTGRVSIGLDFERKDETAAGKTWTGTDDDFGRVIE